MSRPASPRLPFEPINTEARGATIDTPIGLLPLHPRIIKDQLRLMIHVSLRDHRVGERDHVEPFVEQPGRHLGGDFGVAEHDGNDRVLARDDLEPGLGHGRPEELGIVA